MSNVVDNDGNRNSVPDLPDEPRSGEYTGGDGVVHTQLNPTVERAEEREQLPSGELLHQIARVDANVVSKRSRKTYNIQQ